MDETTTTNVEGIQITKTVHPTRFVDTADLVEAKKGKERLRHSNFFFTFNTNEQFSEFQEAEFNARADTLEATWNDVMGNVRDYLRYLEEGGAFNAQKIKNIDYEYSVERGPRTGCLHIHAIVKISHRTRLRWDYEKLRAKMSAGMWPDNPTRRIHMDAKAFAENTITLQEYIHKNYDYLRGKGHDL